MRVRSGGSHHQKLVVIRHRDDPARDIAYVGGIDLAHSRRDDADHASDPQPQTNLAAEYGATPPWHDIQAAISGPAVHDVETVFRERWEDPTTLRRSPLILVQMIAAAPDRVALYGIENRAGTPVYVHAKTCLIDDTWASIGSDNFNRRSWTHDSELSAAVVDHAGNYAPDLRLALAGEHFDRVDLDDCIDPAGMFTTYAETSSEPAVADVSMEVSLRCRGVRLRRRRLRRRHPQGHGIKRPHPDRHDWACGPRRWRHGQLSGERGRAGEQPAPRCAGVQATIVGTVGPDHIHGTPRRDVIVARGGADEIDARRGNDLVCAGLGNDEVSGEAGRDRIFG
jgi:hypothetical protein